GDGLIAEACGDETDDFELARGEAACPWTAGGRLRRGGLGALLLELFHPREIARRRHGSLEPGRRPQVGRRRLRAAGRTGGRGEWGGGGGGWGGGGGGRETDGGGLGSAGAFRRAVPPRRPPSLPPVRRMRAGAMCRRVPRCPAAQ